MKYTPTPYRQAYLDKEAEVVQAKYDFLGWENGWVNTPEKVVGCREAEHRKGYDRTTFDIQGNNSGSANIRGCSKCRYYTKYDCSG